MTYPTKALAPLMLEDYRKVMVERRGEVEQFTSEHITECTKKVIPVDLKQTVQVDKDFQIRAYYAGHVLGAAMFYAKVGDAAMVYTGDYNMTPDKHLVAAQIDRLSLDLVITESTYATTIRDSNFKICSGKRISQRGSQMCCWWGKSANSFICSGKSSGTLYLIGKLLKAQECKGSYLLLRRFDQSSQYVL